jgi:hypothetical protein
MIKCRVLRNCSQGTEPDGRHHFYRKGAIAEWYGPLDQIPTCFEPLEDSAAGAPTGFPEAEKPKEQGPKPQSLKYLDRDSQIVQALEALDHGDKNLWTARGNFEIPRVEAVAMELETLGFSPEVTRQDIQVANPSFVRKPPKP